MSGFVSGRVLDLCNQKLAKLLGNQIHVSEFDNTTSETVSPGTDREEGVEDGEGLSRSRVPHGGFSSWPGCA